MGLFGWLKDKLLGEPEIIPSGTDYEPIVWAEPRERNARTEHEKKFGNKEIEIKPLQSATERMLIKSLIKYGLSPETQYNISRMTVDIAFPEQKVVIEVDGIHHKEYEQSRRDIKRNYFLRSNGWAVWRFQAEKVFLNSDNIAKQIIRRLEKKVGYKTRSDYSEQVYEERHKDNGIEEQEF